MHNIWLFGAKKHTRSILSCGQSKPINEFVVFFSLQSGPSDNLQEFLRIANANTLRFVYSVFLKIFAQNINRVRETGKIK